MIALVDGDVPLGPPDNSPVGWLALGVLIGVVLVLVYDEWWRSRHGQR